MSQPPDNFEHGLVHDEGEAEDYTPEVPQDANGDPVWDPPTFPAWDPEPNCPVLTGAPQMGQISSQPGAGYNQDLQNQMASRGQFDPNNEPLDRLDEARKVAAAAFQVCNNPKNYYGKEGKFYLKFEGWQAIAAFSRLAALSEVAEAEINPLIVMPEGQGKQVILRECTTCHAPDHFVKYHHTEEEWQAIVIRMGQRAKLTSRDDLDAIQKYLASNFPPVVEVGKVNVNKATAQEIAAQLSLTPSEAAAVVQYREKHGQFLLWGELLGIYGVDGRKVEAAKERMSF